MTVGDSYIDQTPVENIWVQHVFDVANTIMRRGSQYLTKKGDADIFVLPGGMRMTVQGTWFNADIKLTGDGWNYHIYVRPATSNVREVSKAGFLGHSSRFAEDFMTLKMMF